MSIGPHEKTIHKFGRVVATTSFQPVAFGGFYRTPQVGSEQQLRVAAGNINDAAAGTGARAVLLQGLDSAGNEVYETVTTNGAVAGTLSTQSFLRLFRATVTSSGTYATQSLGSHVGAIVIEDGAANKWAEIDNIGFPKGQSQIAAYTVPLGKKAFIKHISINTDDTKALDVVLFQRRDILQTTPPYSAMRLISDKASVSAPIDSLYNAALGPYPALTDLGFLCKTKAGTSEVDIDFEIVLINA